MRSQPYDSAVLFVHGIGEQQRGATLGEFGGSLLDSARAWYGAENVHDVPSGLPSNDDTPEHRAVLVTRPGHEPLHLLLAESHWGVEVEPPGWGALMGWLTSTVPFLVQRAVDAGMRRSSRKIDGSARALATAGYGALRLVQNVFAVALALLVLGGLFAIGLVSGLAPVSERRFWLPYRLRAIVVGFIGDSYALLHENGSHNAIVERVASDLAWVEAAAGAAPVVLVAHSQGAEVARRALTRRAPAQPALAGLVTFGAGIAKLDAVDKLRGQRGRSFGAFALRQLSAVCVVLATVVLAGLWTPPSPRLAVGLGLLALAACSLTAARTVLQRIVGSRLTPEALGIDERRLSHWTDLHASHDPVSEGDLPVAECTRGYSRTLVNRRSMLHDHVAYWDNVEGFQATVALEIDRATQRDANPRRPAALADAERARTRTICAIDRVRLAVAGLVPALWIALDASLLGGGLLVAVGAGLLVAAGKLLGARAKARTRALMTARTSPAATPPLVAA